MSTYKGYLQDANGDILLPNISWDNIIDRPNPYPIGAIYLSVNATNPSELFGGTWEQIKDTFLLSAGDTYENGSTGGSANNVLTTDQLPAHTHGSKTLTGTWRNGNARFPGTTTASGIITNYKASIAGYWSETGGTDTNTTGFTINATHEHESVGNGAEINNMPPYLTVYMWKRIA